MVRSLYLTFFTATPDILCFVLPAVLKKKIILIWSVSVDLARWSTVERLIAIDCLKDGQIPSPLSHVIQTTAIGKSRQGKGASGRLEDYICILLYTSAVYHSQIKKANPA
jgi:hypothetical protein